MSTVIVVLFFNTFMPGGPLAVWSLLLIVELFPEYFMGGYLISLIERTDAS